MRLPCSEGADISKEPESLSLKGNYTRLLVSLSVSVIFLYMAFRDVDFGEMKSSMVSADIRWGAVAFFFGALSLILRAVRWGMLLPAGMSPTLWKLHSYLVIGHAANNVLPLRAGEVIRACFISGRENIPLPTVLASVAVERLLDILVLLLLLASTMGLLPELPPVIQSAAYMMGILAFFGVAACAVIWAYRDKAMLILEKIVCVFGPGIQKRIIPGLQSLIEGLGAIGQPLRFLKVIVMSILSWLASVGIYWAIIRAFNFPLGISAAGFSVSLTSFGIALPAAPGFVGTFHLASQQSLVLLGIDAEPALCYAVLNHAVSYMYVTGFGALSFLLLGYIRK